jgi:hypothetical protein
VHLLPHFVYHHHSKRAVLCIVTPYMIQSPLCVTNGRYCVKQGPYGLLGLYGDLGLTYTDCCVVRGCSDLAVLHPYCLRMWVSYDRVQVTAQQRYGCQLPCTHCSIVGYGVLFSIGRGSTYNMYLSHSNLGTYSPVLSSTQIDWFLISHTLKLR